MLRLLMLVLMLIPPTVVEADPPSSYPFQRFDQALKQSAVSGKPLFVYFGRYGCGYCEKTNKEAFSDPVVRRTYTDHYELAYVDAESGRRLRLPSGERITERELGARYKAFVTPVFSYMTLDGKLLERLVGVQDKQGLLEADGKIQHALGKASAR
ncbi:MAG: thioredoxin fold domain-containing protein [Candidatus Thiodiazotropha sp. (ex Dulcina madagascariensis)]|nr:thioredoxin fold domain-containing protein [Candidatus Thiodiazotropha sp. (ex Dulcina madagascariensis)]MCU7926403.1 thioredoxin fold domain-containing protein [Candidatus Thiodiazotropha sp. (ex Dulcina madagascariensis)]